jgi:hypothetical protein
VEDQGTASQREAGAQRDELDQHGVCATEAAKRTCSERTEGVCSKSSLRRGRPTP